MAAYECGEACNIAPIGLIPSISYYLLTRF